MDEVQIIDTTPDNVLEYGVCGYKNIKKPGLIEKVGWLKTHFSEGVRIKTLYSGKDGTQGMIEYIPSEYGWRPVDAGGYMLIRCIFVGFRKACKGKGYGWLLLEACLDDAAKARMNSVAVVTRKGSFMAGKEIFRKYGFETVDAAAPDFELLAKRLRGHEPTPRFKGNCEKKLRRYGTGLTIRRVDQCPYSVKNVAEIVETAKRAYGLEPRVVDLRSCLEAQDSPCPFGTFCILHGGEVIADHPISNTRFINIMNKRTL